MTSRNEFDLVQKINLITEKERGKKSSEWNKKHSKRCEKYCDLCIDLFFAGNSFKWSPCYSEGFWWVSTAFTLEKFYCVFAIRTSWQIRWSCIYMQQLQLILITCMLVHNMEWFKKYSVSKRKAVVVSHNYRRILNFCVWLGS
jgi:hypothetical protein